MFANIQGSVAEGGRSGRRIDRAQRSVVSGLAALREEPGLRHLPKFAAWTFAKMRASVASLGRPAVMTPS